MVSCRLRESIQSGLGSDPRWTGSLAVLCCHENFPLLCKWPWLTSIMFSPNTFSCGHKLCFFPRSLVWVWGGSRIWSLGFHPQLHVAWTSCHVLLSSLLGATHSFSLRKVLGSEMQIQSWDGATLHFTEKNIVPCPRLMNLSSKEEPVL